MKLNSTGSDQKIAVKMYERFISGTGADYSNEELTNIIKEIF